MWVLVVCMSSLEKCLLRFCPFFDWVVCFLLLSYMSCLYNLEIKLLSVASFENVFSQSIDFLFVLLMGLPRWCSGKESACNAGDTRDVGSMPRLGRSPGKGKGYSLQYSGLEKSMDCMELQRVRHD